MSFVINDNTITIEKTDEHIYLQVINNKFLIFEKYIIQEDLSNNFNIDKFHIFIIKCLKKDKNYNIELINNHTQLIIIFSLELNDYIVSQNIILELKVFTESEEQTIKINILQIEIKELQDQLNKISKENETIKTKYEEIVKYLHEFKEELKENIKES